MINSHQIVFMCEKHFELLEELEARDINEPSSKVGLGMVLFEEARRVEFDF